MTGAEMGMGSPDILFLPGYTETARDFLLVADELQSRGFSICFRLIHNHPALVRLVSDAGYPPAYYAEPDDILHISAAPEMRESQARHESVMPLGKRIRRLFRRPAQMLGVAAPVYELFRQLKALRTAENLLEKVQPRVIVMDADSMTPVLHISHVARLSGVPTVVVQSTLLGPPQWLADRNTNLQDHNQERKGFIERIATRAVERFWPAFVQRVDGKAVLNLAGPFPVLVAAVLGVLPISNWLQFGGFGAAYAVGGDLARDVLIPYGIDPHKIHVCGQPRIDRAVSLSTIRTEEAERARASTEPSSSEIRVLVATDPWELYGVFTRDEKRRVVRTAIHAILEGSDRCRVVVKPHPKEDPDEYEDILTGLPRCDVFHGEDIVDAIAVCDVFVTQVCTAAFFAVAAGRPVLTFNFDGRAIFEALHDRGIGTHCRSATELQCAVTALAAGGSLPEPSEDDWRALSLYSRVDGGATSALADLIEKQITG